MHANCETELNILDTLGANPFMSKLYLIVLLPLP